MNARSARSEECSEVDSDLAAQPKKHASTGGDIKCGVLAGRLQHGCGGLLCLRLKLAGAVFAARAARKSRFPSGGIQHCGARRWVMLLNLFELGRRW